MAQSQLMTGHDGTEVRCYRRGARNVVAGDYLPEHGAHVTGAPMTDPETGWIWLTLDNGTDLECTPRGKVWLHRAYASPAWHREAVAAYRDARDAWLALRESGTVVPAGAVAGAAGANVAAYQLSDAEFRAAYPAPRLADFIREAAAAQREGVAA